MVFTTPKWVGDLPCEAPEATLVGDFVFNETWYRSPAKARNGKLVCAATAASMTLEAIGERVDLLARSLCHNLNWQPGEGSSSQKVVGIFSMNAMDFLTLCWAIHRAGGVALLLHATSSPAEIEAHMKASNCAAVFTNNVLLPACLPAASSAGISADRVYILDVPGDAKSEDPRRSVESLIAEGRSLDPFSPVNWDDETGAERVAYLCPTTGTGGVQKLAIVTHRGIITNMMQGRTFDEAVELAGGSQIGLGILPLSHSYGLVIAQALLWRGDTLILHPRFEIQAMLKSIMQFKIDRLYLIPPVVEALARNAFLLDMCDLSSVKYIVTGAGGLSKELGEKMRALRPGWVIQPAYGLTECAVIVSVTSERSILSGSSGVLLPRYQARLIDEEGREIEKYGEAGELLLQTPSVMKGYLGDDEGTKAAFNSAGWLRTGDVALFRPADDGTEHLFIVDRLKDMIKVKGMQISSVDIEACLRLHPDVADAAVVAVSDSRDGERAKAFIVRSPSGATKEEAELKKAIAKHVEEHLTEPHWLHRRVEFMEQLPRNQAGKVLKYKIRMAASEKTSNGTAH